MWEKRNILYKILVCKPDIDTRMWTGYMRRYTSGVLLWTRQWTFKFSKRPSQWPLACWYCGFEPRQGNGRRSLRTVVCCQAEFSATGRSLVRRGLTQCLVYDREASAMRWTWHTGWERGGFCAMRQKISRTVDSQGTSQALCDTVS